MSARVKLALSYVAFLLVAMLGLMALLFYLLRFVPNTQVNATSVGFVPTRDDLLDALWPRLLQVLAVLLVLGLVGGWLVAGRMLRPLALIHAVAEQVAQGSLEHRVSMAGNHDEFRDLADTFDSMLDRLQGEFENQRRFAANASHELRTPYAIERAMLDVALVDPGGVDVGRLVQRLDETNRRGTETLAALLSLSRLDYSDAIAIEPVDVAAIVSEALHEIRPLADSAGIVISSLVEEGDTDGEPVLVRQLVANLLINGIRHNSGPGGRLHVATRTHPDAMVELIVTNSGSVIPPDRLPTLVEPFVRGIGRISSGSEERAIDGSGLGLALVKRIAQAHQAEMNLHAPTDGGLRVSIVFPGPRSPESVRA